jgi:hypothetical protein
MTMKLWILERVEVRPEGIDPWYYGYDKTIAFVVRAETESEARNATTEMWNEESEGDIKPWLDAKHTSCAPLLTEGRAGVVIRDAVNG